MLEWLESKRDNCTIRLAARGELAHSGKNLIPKSLIPEKGLAGGVTEQERTELEAQLARLRQEHRDLDSAIEALQVSPGNDVIQVQRLKKRKLVLRDKIGAIEDELTPDISA